MRTAKEIRITALQESESTQLYAVPEHVAEHGYADPLCEPLPARLEGPALRRHGEEEGQADAAQREGVVPGLEEGLVVVLDGEAVHGLAEEDGEERGAHAEHHRGLGGSSKDLKNCLKRIQKIFLKKRYVP